MLLMLVTIIDCHTKFMSSFTTAAVKATHSGQEDVDMSDKTLEDGIRVLKADKTHIWNAVDLHFIYRI